MKGHCMCKKVLFFFAAVLALSSIAVLPAETEREYPFEVVISLEEVRDMVVGFDPRLEPFAHDFFVQINEIVQAFSDTIYHQDITRLEPFASKNMVVIAKGNFWAIQIQDIFWEVIHMSMSVTEWQRWGKIIIESEPNISSFTISTPQSTLYSADQGINIGLLFRHGEIFNRPLFEGINTWPFPNDLPDVVFSFSAMPIASPFENSWHRAWIVRLRLENLRYRIVDISSE